MGDVENIITNLRKVRKLLPPFGSNKRAIVLSYVAEREIKNLSIEKINEYAPCIERALGGNTVFGMTLLASSAIDDSVAFAFDSVEEARAFINFAENLKAMGKTLDEITNSWNYKLIHVKNIGSNHSG